MEFRHSLMVQHCGERLSVGIGLNEWCSANYWTWLKIGESRAVLTREELE
jgi:hypothetical protein